MDKVVVFGGSGFVGSHTADELSRRGYSVTIFDRKPSAWLREDQQMVVGDILDRDNVAEVAQGARYLYHFAGIADIDDAKNHPFDTIHLNIMGTTVVLEAAIKAKVKRFVYASTMYVYGPYGSFYRASKQAAETVIEAYHERYDLNYTLLRYGSLYGPRSQDWNGLKSYVKQAVREEKLIYRGSGKERREYIHVQGAARLSVDVLDEEHKNQAITVTGNQVLNSEELINMIFEIVGLEVNVAFTDAGKSPGHYTMTPYRYTPRKAKKLISAEYVDIGQGILDLVEEINQEIDDD